MDEASISIAVSCPNTTLFSDFSKSFNTSESFFEMRLDGIRAILAIISSISLTPITFFFLLGGNKLWAAPASSITSIALSGSFLSWIYLFASSTETFKHSLEYFILWCSSKYCFNPFNILILSSIDGSTTSIFWKRLAKALSFSKWFLNSL